MSNSLDMSLDDIIKTQKTHRSRGAPRGGRDNRPYQAGVQQYRNVPMAPLHTSVIRQSAPDGSKMQVSNLDLRVTAEDLKVI
ncbi:hypothetical protein BGZ76_004139 [Entomortierella beljakovae]|nr:hypothetical protein BGZ76_004139 [Entomortierella beljakovae]